MSETAAQPPASDDSAIGWINIGFHGTKRSFHFRKGTSDEGIFSEILVRQDYNLAHLKARQADLLQFMARSVAAGKPPLIIDGGANIGASSVYFCLYDLAAQVIAIEPDKGNFDLLQKNCQGLSVTPLRAALSATPGAALVIDPHLDNVGFRTEKTENISENTVPCVTINELYASHPNLTPFAVKIDIEGAEGELFSANTEWVERTPLIIIELHDWMLPKGRTAQPFLKCISQYDRDFVHIGENIFSISNSI